jgi:acyl-CoA synthetase (AMP-forming)/AMP-acid ligase II
MVPQPGVATRTKAVPFACDLSAFGDRVALVSTNGEMTYAELGERVEAFARRLGAQRRLVLLAGANTVDAVVAYLAALAGGHPLLLAPGDHEEGFDSLIATYDPDVIIRDGARVEERRAGSEHVVHPDLALLLSTSGSTGSAKLVRLSHENLQANAESIAEYLGISPDDRAATTLPMAYCYGLSVINSHLLRGASLLLTDRSVADARFWAAFRAHRATTFAGVPYTFDLLDRVGFDRMDLPQLRYVTQAGGRLAPDRVRAYAELGRRSGWDLFVMYGQTEATARMAYLPPDLAANSPHCIGIPIPGGSLRLEPIPDWPDPGVGELVYAGANVMLGYAEGATDLRVGRTVEELHTGDLARRTPDGLFEIVGRRSRIAKVFGLRIDLHHVEASLERDGVTACCLARDDRLAVVVESGRGDAGRVRRLAARACRLPVGAVRVCPLAELPRLANGKPDYPAMRALAHSVDDGSDVAPPSGVAGPVELVALFAEILERDDVTEDSTFVSLGGDSLSYVEVSVRLEQILGHLPAEWPSTPIRELHRARRRRRRTASLDTSVALRAAAIVLIVGTHAALFGVPGGAHVLLAVAGFNFARFHVTSAVRRVRIRGIGRSVRRIVLASMCWIALASLFLTDGYGWIRMFLLHNILGPPGRFNDFWFIEALIYMMLAMLALLAIPPVDRAERRYPFALPMVLMTVSLVTRYQLFPGVKLGTPLAAFWLFALGWSAAKATTGWQRLLVSAASVATILGFHHDLAREAVMIGGLVVLTWIPTVPSLPVVNRVAGALAAASLYIYLTHWQVFSRLDSPLLGVTASLAVGIAYAAVAGRISAGLAYITARLPGRARPGNPPPVADSAPAAARRCEPA